MVAQDPFLHDALHMNLQSSLLCSIGPHNLSIYEAAISIK